jgi:type VI protein secretion system component Hcp
MGKWSGVFIGALAAAILGTPALADGYLTIDGIAVPPADTNDPGWMKVRSYALDTTAPNPNNASGASAGRVSLSTAQITRNQDGVSPALFSATGSGRTFQQATLDVPAADGSQIVYKFMGVKITNDQVSSGGGAPQETLTLTYAAMQELDQSGTVLSNGATLRIPALTTNLNRSSAQTPSTGTPASGRPPLTATVHNPWAH